MHKVSLTEAVTTPIGTFPDTCSHKWHTTNDTEKQYKNCKLFLQSCSNCGATRAKLKAETSEELNSVLEQATTENVTHE